MVTALRGSRCRAAMPAMVAAMPAWLVAYAQQYGISQIRYAGYVWNAANGTMGWQRAGKTASPVPHSSIVAV